MKKLLFFLIVTFFSFNSCKSSKQAKSKNVMPSKVIIGANTNEDIYTEKNSGAKDINASSGSINPTVSKAYNIVEYAKQFKGVRYKFGGATKSGMDCSGLVFESFRAHNIILPRISRDMAKNGDKIPLNNVGIGDLVFFKTGSRRNDISHVGLVVSSDDNGNIQFIHSTTSAGVIISSITETYWDKTFVEARRIL